MPRCALCQQVLLGIFLSSVHSLHNKLAEFHLSPPRHGSPHHSSPEMCQTCLFYDGEATCWPDYIVSVTLGHWPEGGDHMGAATVWDPWIIQSNNWKGNHCQLLLLTVTDTKDTQRGKPEMNHRRFQWLVLLTAYWESLTSVSNESFLHVPGMTTRGITCWRCIQKTLFWCNLQYGKEGAHRTPLYSVSEIVSRLYSTS